ncbi:hypothetical protein OPQ81_000745 [Rhizoctonia solani]|nr:hypothetical protein OPQ81_000745 [Rhizoctonia solani]
MTSLLSGLSRIVATISSPEGGTDNTPVEVTNLKALGSYNWIEEQVPTIAIPGLPAVWRDQRIPIRLREDLGAPFFDEGIARKCGFPLEPDILAIEVSQAADPSFDLSNEKIDIVTNRNNLRKLISFANLGDRIGGRYSNEFRIDAQLAPNGRTMILTRFEKPRYGQQALNYNRQQNNVRQQNNRRQQNNGLQQNNIRQQNNQSIGYDHIFERMCTEELPTIHATDYSGNNLPLRPIGYHRIVRYDLIGLRFLVRSRVDGMLPRPTQSQREPALEPGIDDLVEALGRTRLEPEIANPGTQLVQREGSGVRYVNFGEHIPQDLLMDIMLVPNGNVNWKDAYPQFFLSQTPNLRVATRTTGPGPKSVTRLQLHDQSSLRAEHDIQSQRFRNLIYVLKQMLQTIQAHGSSSQPLAFVWNRAARRDLLAYRVEEMGEYLSDRGLERF